MRGHPQQRLREQLGPSRSQFKLGSPTQPMRILLQHKKTGLYFSDIDSWVQNSSEATDFVSSTAAIEFCVTNKLNDVHLVLKFHELKYDIVMPLQYSRNLRQRPVKT